MRVVGSERPVSVPIHKGVYILPNLITTAGLFAGFYSIISSFRGEFVVAAIAIMLANIFDILDGRIARVTKATSPFGVQYDSLCDLVAFGVAPGLLMYRWALEPWGTWGWLAASMFVACGALRLARFNVQFDHSEKRYFRGLPTPAAAEMIASTVLLYVYVGGPELTQRHVSALLAVYALAGLMVSNVLYYSFKEIRIHRRQPFWVLLAVIVLLKVFIAEPQVLLFSAFFLYVLSGPARWLFLRLRWAVTRARRRRGLTTRENSSTYEAS